MATEAITIEIDSEAANLFRGASPEAREKMQALVSHLLRELSGSNGRSLKEVVNEIGGQARERGMNQEILDSLRDKKYEQPDQPKPTPAPLASRVRVHFQIP